MRAVVVPPVTVAALYVEKNGVYAGLPDVEVWDEARDARLYAGPHPVVAHPPCNRWCRFAKGIEKVHGYKVGDDGGCFEAALNAVRTYGGVLWSTPPIRSPGPKPRPKRDIVNEMPWDLEP